jgi:SAM-dependent methyltransferase
VQAIASALKIPDSGWNVIALGQQAFASRTHPAFLLKYLSLLSLWEALMSVDYYNQNARNFFDGTVAVDMVPLYQRFLPLLPPHAHILDAGCGSGRDSRYFLDQRFAVTAMDASQELAQLAQSLLQQAVTVCRFDEFQASKPLDAIWACASLLHVPLAELPAVMAHLTAQLKARGIFYCSFKYGSGQVSRDGRTFTNLDEAGLDALLHSLPLQTVPLRIIDIWQTGDLRPGRESERWLNVVLQKESR